MRYLTQKILRDKMESKQKIHGYLKEISKGAHSHFPGFKKAYLLVQKA